jgi:antitoxin component YwqK of YwqJK toxin-antitoxin module
MVNQIINNGRKGFWKIRLCDDGGVKTNSGYYECNYVEGVKHGLYKRFTGKNILVEIGEYHYGKKINLWKEYTYTGKLWKETNYGVNLIDERIYHHNKLWRWRIDMCENGKIKRWYIEYYEKGQRKGIQIFEDEKIKAKWLYIGGKLIYRIDCEKMVHCINI